MCGTARQPRLGREDNAFRGSGAPRRGLPGEQPGADGHAFGSGVEPTGRPPRDPVPPQRLLQAEFHAGHHEVTERRIQNRRQQRGRSGRATVFGVLVRQKSSAGLTDELLAARQSGPSCSVWS